MLKIFQFCLYLFEFISWYLNTWILKCQLNKIFWYLDTWIPGFLDTWIPGYLDTCIPGYLDTWIPGYLDTWIPGYLDTWIPGCILLVAVDVMGTRTWRCLTGISDNLKKLHKINLLFYLDNARYFSWQLSISFCSKNRINVKIAIHFYRVGSISFT